jgi:predicted AlkP superfamily phosphohydrolase/phosphomutase
MELSNNSSLSSSFLYQQIAKDKSESSSIQKDLKSTFEKNDSIDISNNKNTQRDEESKKIENITSSIPSLNNAKEELIKNSNLNKLFIQSLT